MNLLTPQDEEKLHELCEQYEIDFELIQKIMKLELESRYDKSSRSLQIELARCIEDYIQEKEG